MNGRCAFGPVFVVMLVAAGCHEPYSNEDLRFLYQGIPRDIEIEVPIEDGSVTGVGTPGGPPPTGTARFYGDARKTADAINKDVLALLAWVDQIVAEPPSGRTNDQRVWGPFPDGNGAVFTLVANRVQTSTVFRATSTSTATDVDELFSYTMFAGAEDSDESGLLFSGQQVADPDGAGAQGRLLLDLDVAGRVDPTQTGRGQVVVAYDNRFDQLTVEMALGALYVGEAPTAAWRHTQEETADEAGTPAVGAGSFIFYILENVDPITDELETWAVAARWLNDGRGRADVLIAGGDLALPLIASECWDADFTRTYILSNIPDPAYFPAGQLTDCAPELRSSQFPE